jgi:hypothetical protein
MEKSQKGIRMTKEQIRYIENHLQLCNRELAGRLNKTESQIRNFLFREQIRRTPEQLEQIRLRIAGIQRGENNGNWRNGISKNNYHYKKLQVQRYPERIRARQRVYYHKRAGNITPGACEECGTTFSVEAHHPDYSEPIDIVWFCSVCHREHHQKEREQAETGLVTVSNK